MAVNEFVRKNAGSFTIWLNDEYVDSPLQDALADGYSSLSQAYSLKKIPASKSAEVYKFTYQAENTKAALYFKQYHYRSIWDFIKHIFRPSRAKRTMQATAMLKKNGFCSPAIVSMGHRLNKIFNAENFLLTREVENALPMYSFFQEHYGKSVSPDILLDKRKFIETFGHFVGRLHSKNISHGDLRLGNVLVRKTEGDCEFFLLDNERTVQYCRLPNRLRVKNLVQVNMFQSNRLTQTDRLRFFKAYLLENQRLAPEWKKLISKVHHKTAGRLATKNQLLDA